MSDGPQQFHSFCEVARRWSNRGWTDASRAEVWDELLALPAGRRLTQLLGHELGSLAQAVAGSVVADLHESRSHAARTDRNLNLIVSLALEAVATARRHPVADGYLSWLRNALPSASDPPGWLEGLTFRARHGVLRAGCADPAALAAYGSARLLRLRGVGETTVREIRAWLLDRHQLRLAGPGQGRRRPR